MRDTASILHVDLDAFFASAEQRDKPSLRGRPVIVGGIGPRGVVATASYEARAYGVRSAMSTAEARSRCPNAAFLTGRFDVYSRDSATVMGVLRGISPTVEPLSGDEAFVDLGPEGPTWAELPHFVSDLRHTIAATTGGLTCSVGVASSKLLAKIASELNKPNGEFLVQPGTERQILEPLPITALPGVGPATAQRLHHVGVARIRDVLSFSLDELQNLLGEAAGHSVYEKARAQDDRPVIAGRDNKSISIEDTFHHDIRDREELLRIIDRLCARLSLRLTNKKLAGRTITLKVRHRDFTSATRSLTLAGPTDELDRIRAAARRLLDEHEIGDGLRLMGVGVSGLADWVQEELFTDLELPEISDETPATSSRHRHEWRPGMDVHHVEAGDGWVWGAGMGVVTVRFETRHTAPGPVRSFDVEDPKLRPGHVGTVVS